MIYRTKYGILYLGDCNLILKSIPTGTIDLIIADPPYGVSKTDDYKDKGWNVKEVGKELYRVLKDNTRLFLFCAEKKLCDVIKTLEDVGFKLHQMLIWVRKNLVGGSKKYQYWDFVNNYEHILLFHKGKPAPLKIVAPYRNVDVLEYAKPQGNFKKDTAYHPHQKPLELIKHLIIVSTNPGDIVLDPFAGVGTTAVAAEILKRRWIAIEIEKKFFEKAIMRLQQIKQATLF